MTGIYKIQSKHVPTEESKNKIREAGMGRIMSEESRHKISVSRKKWFQSKKVA
jgi:hypothetical protein